MFYRLVILLLLWSPFAGAQQQPYALMGVNVVDVERGQILPDQTVLIAEGKILRILPRLDLVKGFRIIPAKGRYLIPGLIDSHVHLHYFFQSGQRQLMKAPLEVLLYYGVTGIREASGSVYTAEMVALRDSIRSGKITGPEMYVSGIATATNLKKYQLPGYRELVKKFKEMGVDGIKVKFTSLAETREIIDAAHPLGLPVYGHTANLFHPDPGNPLGDFTPEIVDYGIDGVMHTAGFPPVRPGTLPAPPPAGQWEAWWLYMDALWLYADTAKENALIRNMVRKQIWLEPTLTVEQNVTDSEQYKNDPGLKFALSTYDNYFSGFPALSANARDTAILAFRRKGLFVKKFADAGGRVLAGTDHLYGSGLHKELQLLVDAGLTPAEALKAATVNNATALGWIRERGTVAEGKEASLVLLDGNPLSDIRNLERIRAVIVRGNYFDERARKDLLKQAENLVTKNTP